MEHQLKLTALLLAACSGAALANAAENPILLPSPSGQSALAGWVPTNAQIVAGKLEYDGPWTGYSGVNASYTTASGSYVFTSNIIPNAGSSAAGLYTGNQSGAALGVSVNGYNGPSFTQITLQLAMNSTSGNDTEPNLNALLSIGGNPLGYAPTYFDSNHNFQPTGFNTDPTNRYYGHWGVLTLVTITWDLDALGFTGDLSDFDIDWSLSSSHSALYDVQISVNAVPEPTTVAAIVSAIALGCVALRRRRKHSA